MINFPSLVFTKCLKISQLGIHKIFHIITSENTDSGPFATTDVMTSQLLYHLPDGELLEKANFSGAIIIAKALRSLYNVDSRNKDCKKEK